MVLQRAEKGTISAIEKCALRREGSLRHTVYYVYLSPGAQSRRRGYGTHAFSFSSNGLTSPPCIALSARVLGNNYFSSSGLLPARSPPAGTLTGPSQQCFHLHAAKSPSDQLSASRTRTGTKSRLKRSLIRQLRMLLILYFRLISHRINRPILHSSPEVARSRRRLANISMSTQESDC